LYSKALTYLCGSFINWIDLSPFACRPFTIQKTKGLFVLLSRHALISTPVGCSVHWMGNFFIQFLIFLGLTLYFYFSFSCFFFPALTSPTLWFQNITFHFHSIYQLAPVYILYSPHRHLHTHPPLNLLAHLPTRKHTHRLTYLLIHPSTFLPTYHLKYCEKYKYCKNLSTFILLSIWEYKFSALHVSIAFRNTHTWFFFFSFQLIFLLLLT
jgi:hypothetical protein